VALYGEAKQSSDYSTMGTGAAALAVDGNTNGDYLDGKSCTYTKADKNTWWKVMGYIS